MCICALKPEGKTISKESLQACYNNNKDGAGFMYSEDNKLIIKKGYFSFDEFYRDYKPIEDKKVVLHFRIKTHGDVNKDNCHPFQVSNNMAFVHNGIINIEEDHKEFSDTWHFNEKIIKPMYKDNQGFLKKLYMKKLITDFVGNSKLIFMNNKGITHIINSTKGIWEDGVWYSNSSYKPRPVVHQIPSKFSNTPKYIEGDTVELRYKYHNLEKGEWVYIENVLPNNMIEVVSHDWSNGMCLETKHVIPSYAIKDISTYWS